MSTMQDTQKHSGPLLVVAALVTSGTVNEADEKQTSVGAFKILIAQRRLQDRIEPGKWEFPGGKVEFGESPQAALKREIKEELDLDIEVGEFLGLASHIYESEARRLHVILLCYVCRKVGGEIRLLAVQDAKWILPNEIGHYEYAAADLPLIERAKIYFRQHF